MLRQLRESRGWSWSDLARALRDTARRLAVTSLMHRQVASIQRTVARWESITDRTSPGDRYQFLQPSESGKRGGSFGHGVAKTSSPNSTITFMTR